MSPIRSSSPRGYVAELLRKSIHLAFVLLPLQLLTPYLPWPRTNTEVRLFLLGLGVVFLGIDFLRMHHPRVGALFRAFFGGMIRKHERFTLLGSSYLVLAAIIAITVFPRPMAATALGFTILGDAAAAMVGRRWGRVNLFGKTLEGGLAGLATCLLWGLFVASTGAPPLWVIACGALVASLVEILPIPVDDNLRITLLSAFTMRLLWPPA